MQLSSWFNHCDRSLGSSEYGTATEAWCLPTWLTRYGFMAECYCCTT